MLIFVHTRASIQCRQDNNSHMGPTYSAQFQGLESAIKVSPNMTFFYPIKRKNYTRRIKSGFSEVLRTSLSPSQKIQLILTILTVVSLFPYLFWGTRNRKLPFFCLHAFSWNPLVVSGRIIYRWKDIFKRNTAQLESWETVQWGRSYLRNKFDNYGP